MPTYLVYIKKTTAAALVIDSMKPAMGRNKVRTTPGSLTLQLFMAVSFTKEAKRKTWFLCSMPVTEVGFSIAKENCQWVLSFSSLITSNIWKEKVTLLEELQLLKLN